MVYQIPNPPPPLPPEPNPFIMYPEINLIKYDVQVDARLGRFLAFAEQEASSSSGGSDEPLQNVPQHDNTYWLSMVLDKKPI